VRGFLFIIGIYIDMRDLIRRVLKEEVSNKYSTGCEFFPKNSTDYRWCKFAENKLSKTTKKAKLAIERYKKDYLSDYGGEYKAVKYNKSIDFFKDRRSDVINALEKFKSTCPSLYNYVIQQMNKFVESFVILNQKNEYDLLNKLNTNWSALALMLTSELPEDYKNLDFEKSLNYFFEDTDEKSGTTPFEKFLDRLLIGSNDELKEKIYSTIKEKTKAGQEIEDEFYNYISKYTETIQYAGDYSFMDMIGIDMVVKNPDNEWVPVQVKKYSGGCDKAEYRKSMCENWCVSYEKNVWKIKVFKGDNLEKNKVQCKNLPLNKTTYLNVHVDDSGVDQESCDTKEIILKNPDF